MTDAVVVEEVTKRYKEVVALDSVTLRAQEGEVLGILGPSGAGKSTLLRIIDLLEPPDRGKVVIEGREVTAESGDAHRARRSIGMVLQKPVVLGRSVRNNLAYALRIRGWDEERMYQRVDAELERIGLSGRSGRHARTLSGGEMQRLCFARATIFDPKILLLDEFAANLDPANVAMIEGQLKGFMSGGKGRTTIIVTHNLFQAKRLCDRVALLWDGQVVEVAPNKKFFQNPDDARTAAFVRGELVY